jgi:hypothetical protein
MRPWLYVIAWKNLWHMPDICYKCKVEIHGQCVPTQIGSRCVCHRGKCRHRVKPTGRGFEKGKDVLWFTPGPRSQRTTVADPV